MEWWIYFWIEIDIFFQAKMYPVLDSCERVSLHFIIQWLWDVKYETIKYSNYFIIQFTYANHSWDKIFNKIYLNSVKHLCAIFLSLPERNSANIKIVFEFRSTNMPFNVSSNRWCLIHLSLLSFYQFLPTISLQIDSQA